MNDIEFGYNGVVNFLRSLKTKKASGRDEIPNYVLKKCADAIAH